MSPQNSQRICRHGPQGGVGERVSATTAMRVNARMPIRHRLEHRRALGAEGEAVGRVLDVAPGMMLPSAVSSAAPTLNPENVRDGPLAGRRASTISSASVTRVMLADRSSDALDQRR